MENHLIQAKHVILFLKRTTIPVTATKMLVSKGVKLTYRHRVGSPLPRWKQSAHEKAQVPDLKKEIAQEVIPFC